MTETDLRHGAESPPIWRIGHVLGPAGNGLRAAIAWTSVPNRGLVVLICATFLARLLFSACLGLGVDESYTVAVARKLQLSYYDHPPLSAWLAWAISHLAGSESATVVRLPFVGLFALTTFLMYRLTANAFGARAGLSAALVLNLIPVFGGAAASWVLPDGPLLAALLGAAIALQRAVNANGPAAWRWWLAAGICAGLALLSKYTAVLTIAGAFAFLVSTSNHRVWLARPHVYVAALIALIIFMPVVYWNAEHNWASFVFQGGRALGQVHPFGLVSTIAGEAMLLLPWIWLPLVLCGFEALRAGPGAESRWLLVCLAAPPLLLFTVVSLWSRVQFHWAAPGYLFLLPLLGDAIARYKSRRVIRIWLTVTAAVVAAAAVLIATEVRYNWLANLTGDFGSTLDPAIEALDWTSLRTDLAQRGLLEKPGLVVAALKWSDAGKIDYALGGSPPVTCLCTDARQYGVIAPMDKYIGRDILIVAPRTKGIEPWFRSLFDSIEPLDPSAVLHAGRPAMALPLAVGHRLRYGAGEIDWLRLGSSPRVR